MSPKQQHGRPSPPSSHKDQQLDSYPQAELLWESSGGYLQNFSNLVEQKTLENPTHRKKDCSFTVLPHPIPQAGAAQCQEGTPQLEEFLFPGKGSGVGGTTWGDSQRLRDTREGGLRGAVTQPGRSSSKASLPEKAAAARRSPGPARQPQEPRRAHRFSPAGGHARAPPALPTQPLWSLGAALAATSGLRGGRRALQDAPAGARPQPPLSPHRALSRSGLSARMRPVCCHCRRHCAHPHTPPSCHLCDACLPVPSTPPHACRGTELSPEAPTSRRPATTCASTAGSSSAA